MILVGNVTGSVYFEVKPFFAKPAYSVKLLAKKREERDRYSGPVR